MPEKVNLGAVHGDSVLEVVRTFEQASGQSVPYRIAPRRPGDVAAYYADASNSGSLPGWWARHNLANNAQMRGAGSKPAAVIYLHQRRVSFAFKMPVLFNGLGKSLDSIFMFATRRKNNPGIRCAISQRIRNFSPRYQNF